MVNLNEKLISRMKQDDYVIGAAILPNNERFPFHANEYDYFLLTVSLQHKNIKDISHIEVDGKRIFVRTIVKELLNQSTAAVRYYNLMDWLVSGEIIYDRDQLLSKLRADIIEIPEAYRDFRKLREFSGFVETLYLTKKSLHEKNVLDAYSQIISAVHYWAHIVLIEEGIHPELTVWQQLRKVHPGVYKLYEELLASPESIEQRVRLVMLACEFTTMNKMRDCCKLLFDVMAEKGQTWSVADLQNHNDLKYVSDDLTLVLRKLVQGHHLREVIEMIDIENDIFEVKYELVK